MLIYYIVFISSANAGYLSCVQCGPIYSSDAVSVLVCVLKRKRCVRLSVGRMGEIAELQGMYKLSCFPEWLHQVAPSPALDSVCFGSAIMKDLSHGGFNFHFPGA